MRTGGVGPLKEGKRWSERKDKRRKERWKGEEEGGRKEGRGISSSDSMKEHRISRWPWAPTWDRVSPRAREAA